MACNFYGPLHNPIFYKGEPFCHVHGIADGLTCERGFVTHAVAVGEPGAAEMTPTPGAMMSMQLPPLEKLAMPSPSCIAPTAVTEGPLPGL